VLGWTLRQWGLADRWSRLGASVWAWRALALGVFAGWLVAVVVNIAPFRDLHLQHWFFYDDSYFDIGAPEWWAGLVRLGLILLAVVLSTAFFVLIPRRETFFSAFGQATMYVYLLHSFVLYPLRESGVLRDDHASATWLLTMVFASTAIAIVLASPLVRRVFRVLVEPKPRWLLSRTAAGGLRPVADPVAPDDRRT
jgi:fucose 4-O-acetylase-like acetyltransferase